jgi:hypothetical protein
MHLVAVVAMSVRSDWRAGSLGSKHGSCVMASVSRAKLFGQIANSRMYEHVASVSVVLLRFIFWEIAGQVRSGT